MQDENVACRVLAIFPRRYSGVRSAVSERPRLEQGTRLPNVPRRTCNSFSNVPVRELDDDVVTRA